MSDEAASSDPNPGDDASSGAAPSVRDDCRHYSSRSMASGETVQRCRLSANEEAPFACPEHCLFFEKRNLESGWQR